MEPEKQGKPKHMWPGITGFAVLGFFSLDWLSQSFFHPLLLFSFLRAEISVLKCFNALWLEIFCFSCLISLLAASVLPSLPQYLCLSGYQFWCVICSPHSAMCSGFNFSKPCLVDHSHSPNHLKLKELFSSFCFFLLLPASSCFFLLLLPFSICCLLFLSAAASSLHWVGSTATGMLSQEPEARGLGPGARPCPYFN